MLLSSNEWKSTLSLSIWRNGVIHLSPYGIKCIKILIRRPHHRRCGEVAFRVTLPRARQLLLPATRFDRSASNCCHCCLPLIFFSYASHNLQIVALPLTR